MVNSKTPKQRINLNALEKKKNKKSIFLKDTEMNQSDEPPKAQMPFDISEIPADINDDAQNYTPDEALAKVVIELAESKNIYALSDIKEREIRVIAALYAEAEATGDKLTKTYLDYYLKLRISKERKGRTELTKIAQAAREQVQGKLQRLGGMLGMGGNI